MGSNPAGRIWNLSENRILDGNADDTPISDVNLSMVTTIEYLGGSDRFPISRTANGALTETDYDFKNRVDEQRVFVRNGKTLVSTKSYHTDFGGKEWETIYDDCCGQVTASENPLGHGSISRSDDAGRSVHQVTVEDVASHSTAYANPIDGKTYREVTTKYDSLGRPVARTTWLTARGTVDVTSPPIAGLGGVSSSDGLTEQYLYDNNLNDGVGLESSGYDKAGNRISFTDGEDQTTSYTCDDAGNKLTETYPDHIVGVQALAAQAQLFTRERIG